MIGERGPEFGRKKVERKELNEEEKEQILSHLNYREEIEKSVLSSVKERLGIPSEPLEVEVHQELVNLNDEWHQEARRQLEMRKLGEQLHSLLEQPTREEEQAKKRT